MTKQKICIHSIWWVLRNFSRYVENSWYHSSDAIDKHFYWSCRFYRVSWNGLLRNAPIKLNDLQSVARRKRLSTKLHLRGKVTERLLKNNMMHRSSYFLKLKRHTFTDWVHKRCIYYEMRFIKSASLLNKKKGQWVTGTIYIYIVNHIYMYIVSA